jgi:AcrR family transcriptional regulator
MASKTKDRILQATRLLFNDEGVSNVAMVDIAATLDISPGNLYYHYRGKEQLIPVLFEQFAAELSALLAADVEGLTSLEDRWAYQYLILDTLYNHRCLHALDAIRFDKSLAKRYRRLQSSLVKVLQALINQLQMDSVASEALGIDEVALMGAGDNQMLAENIALFMFYWSNDAELNLTDDAERHYLHEGVYRVFYQLAFCLGNRQSFLASCEKVMQGASKVKP